MPPVLTLTLEEMAGEQQLSVPEVRIEIVSTSGSVSSAALKMAPVVIGTGPDCDVRVEDNGVSRRHCELSLTTEGVRLRDLGSKNGTFVGSTRIVEAVLSTVEQIRIGNSTVSLVAPGGTTTIPVSKRIQFGEAVGVSVVMRALFAQLERVAARDTPVLLLGETGTGKDVLAHGIHDASSRRDKPFTVVDCAAIPADLIESELFGHVRGAFTGATSDHVGLFERSAGGTVFLDEVGELPMKVQPALLRALEAGEVRPVGGHKSLRPDVRIVSATHRDLRACVREGTFREDLFYRLAVVELIVPPLRDRSEDIPVLVERFLARQTPPRALDELPPNVLALLSAHRWPGNVRELRNAVDRLSLFPPGDPQALHGLAPAGDRGLRTEMTLREARERVLSDFEPRFIAEKLKEHGSVSAAARAMGVSRQFLYTLMARYGLKGRDAE